jgi:hypothetical protein
MESWELGYKDGRAGKESSDGAGHARAYLLGYSRGAVALEEAQFDHRH